MEYNYSPSVFKETLLAVFDTIISEFAEVMHIEKLVMERIFFPKPRYIQSVDPLDEVLQNKRNLIATKIDTVLEPLIKYLTLFKQFEDSINVAVEEYVHSKISIQVLRMINQLVCE